MSQRLPHQEALDAWNAFRMEIAPGETASNIERLMDYQQLVVAAEKNFPPRIFAKEKKKLLQENAGLVMTDEKLRNRYYYLLGEFRKEEAMKTVVQKPKHWEEKFIPNSKDEYEHLKAKEEKKKIQVGYGPKSKDDPNEL